MRTLLKSDATALLGALMSVLVLPACDQADPRAPLNANAEVKSSTSESQPRANTETAESCDEGSSQPGCACSDEARVACDKIHSTAKGRTSCLPGIQVCEAGVWSECRLGFAKADDPLGEDLVGDLSAKNFSANEGLKQKSFGIPPSLRNKIKTAALGTASDCIANPCDPNCQAILDTADHTLSSGSIIFDGTSALTIDNSTEVVDPMGMLSAEDEALLIDSDLMPSGSYLYHEISPDSGATDPDPVLLEAQLSYIDVHFLLDTSATMGEALVELSSELSGSGGIIEKVRGKFPNARFGVSHFHGYEQAPYAQGNRRAPAEVRSLWHSLDMTTDDAQAVNVINWLGSNGVTINVNATEGFSVALFSSYYRDPLYPNIGPYLYRGGGASAGVLDDPNNFWVTPRNSSATPTEWVSDYAGSLPPVPGSGACALVSAAGGMVQGEGYACTAPGAAKIAVLMTDNPTEEGPGGHYAYGRYSTEPIYSATGALQGSSAWPVAIDADAQSNGSFSNAIEIDPTTFSRYHGTFGSSGPTTGHYSAGRDFSSGSYRYVGFTEPPGNFPTLAQFNCANDDGRGAPEAFYKFSLTGTEYLHFDTYGSETDTVLYVIDNASGQRVACSDSAAPLRRESYTAYDPASPIPGGMSEAAALDARLQPGDYTLVVDRKSINDCMPGYKKLGGQCLKNVGTKMSRKDAQSLCFNRGSVLTKINSKAQNNAIGSKSQFSNGSRWIGLQRSGGTWRWQDGQAASYFNWNSGHPRAGEHCAYSRGNGRWNSASCNSSARTEKSICEQPSQAGNSGGYFLQISSMPDSTPIAVPSWEQTVDTLNDAGVRVIGIDVSGMGPVIVDGSGNPSFDTCDCGASGKLCEDKTNVNRWTYPHLQEMARETGAVDGTSTSSWENPFVFALNKEAGPCHAGDASMGDQIGDAILDLTEKGRQDVYLEVIDHDDATDFDYPGAARSTPQLTPLHVDEGPAPALGRPHGLFIDTVTVSNVLNGINGSADLGPAGTTRCHDDPSTPAVIEDCLPDTKVQFNISFSAPAGLPIFDHEQLFSFKVAAKAGGATLTTEDVVLKIPRRRQGNKAFVRDYELSSLCKSGTDPFYGNFTWVAETEGDSNIQFSSVLSDTQLELDTNPATPSAGFAVVANAAVAGGWIAGTPEVTGNTEVGGVYLDSLFENEAVNVNSEFMRVTMTFNPGSDGVSLPKLMAWNLQFSCQPTE